MADTFSIKEENSDESILAHVEKRSKRPTWKSSDRSRHSQPRIVIAHEIIDFQLLCASLLLWVSAIVMLIFSFYILFAEYGPAVLAKLRLVTYAMILQSCAAVMKLFAAALTTSLLKFDSSFIRRLMSALAVILVNIVILVCEIIVAALGKQEIHNENMNILKFPFKVPSQILKNAEVKGYICATWDDKDCYKVYKEHINVYSNLLIGCASVALAIEIIIIPFYIFEYKVMSKDLAQGNAILTSMSRTQLPSTPSFLSVHEETSEEDATPPSNMIRDTRVKLGGEHSRNT